MSSSNKKLTKRQQKALAFQKNRRQKFKKQVTDNNNGGENDLIEEQLVGNEIVNPEKSIKRKHIKEVGELKEIEKEKYKNKNYLDRGFNM
ncbi:9672_t:CDS:1, partial [Scutellospora calospora]